MRGPDRCRVWLGLLVLLTQPLVARQAPLLLPRGFAIGGSLDALSLVGEGNRALPTITLRMGGFNPDGNGLEASLAIAAPGVNRDFGRVALADFDFTRGIALRGPVVLLRGGGGLLIAGGGTPTVNAGLGLVVPLGSRTGVRADLSVRSLLFAFPHLNLLSLGVGLMVLP